MSFAGNSSLSFAGNARKIDASVLANFLPSPTPAFVADDGPPGVEVDDDAVAAAAVVVVEDERQTFDRQTYSHPMTKNGLPRS